ncbi:Acetylcholinesterase-1 [Halotydeus destructor]|nr:Acetylcholinesterase-1 [Halotydeus destructor]
MVVTMRWPAATVILVSTLVGRCSQEYVDVTTKLGVVRGQRLTVLGEQFDQFSGIPYARPPVGRLRFAKPVDTLPWAPKVLDTTKHVAVYCYDGNTTEIESEDCLYLSIWRPARADQSQLLPVYLYLYGGGFRETGGVYDNYNGSYVVRYGVVNVFADYRTSVYGFFHGNRTDAPGNLGIWDQAKVIKWIADYIDAFGGDPRQLTLAGVSSGAATAMILAVSPVTQRYISKVMAISASITGDEASVVINGSQAVATTAGCDTKANYVACLRKLNTSALYEAASAHATYMQPFHGDDLFPMKLMPALRQGRFNKSVPLLTGGSRLEYVILFALICPKVALYVPSSDANVTRADIKACLEEKVSTAVAEEAVTYYLNNVNQSDNDAMQVVGTQAYSEYVFTCPTYFASSIIARQRDSSDVFSVHFTYGTQVTVVECENITWPRPCHDEERFSMFASPYREPSVYNDTDRTYTDQMVRLWATFTQTGRPPSMSGYRWPAYQDPPLAPITPISLARNETPIWPSYLELNPLRPQKAPVYKPYTNCDQFWVKYEQLFDDP